LTYFPKIPIASGKGSLRIISTRDEKREYPFPCLQHYPAIQRSSDPAIQRSSDPAIQRSSDPWRRFVSIGVGSVLIAAAVLKLTGWNVSAFAQYGWLLTPSVQIAAVGWELLLGTTLILGIHRSLTWIAAVVTFAVFAGVSSYLGIIGQASCGCFGAIEASPWTAFGVDIGALFLLAFVRPSFVNKELRIEVIATGKWGAGFVVVAALILGLGICLYGSASGALANLRGDTLTVDRSHVDLGHGQSGDILTQQVTVTNWTKMPRRIIGGTSDCSCIATADLPITLAPGEAKPVTITYKIPHTDQSGLTSRTAILLTDDSKQPRLALTLSAVVD
jgi:Protein of unknown function (DUF1573)